MRMPAFLVLALVCSVRGVPAAPLPGTTQPQQAVRAGRDIAPPTKLKDVKPVYPPIAVTARVQGVVVIEAIIGEDGKVRDARVLRGVPLLDQAALDAVKQWEYEPTLLNGVAVPVIVNVRATFTLSDSPAPPAAPSAEPPFDDL
ncbi:MAG: energy transducer TonB, partial [Acidobacteria bacterium]|nr:energy transducer TonB [Acidobacteriota bacterium]